MKKILTLFIFPLLAASFLLACSEADSQSEINADATATAVKREPANPSFSTDLVRAIDIDGASHELGEWIGKKPVVVNFWGTWCPPCRMEIPGLVQLYAEYKGRGVEIVSLAIERRAGPAQVKQFTQQANMQWVQLMSNDDVLKAFGYAGSVPTTIFFDINGREVARHIGARDYETFKVDFEKIAATQ